MATKAVGCAGFLRRNDTTTRPLIGARIAAEDDGTDDPIAIDHGSPLLISHTAIFVGSFSNDLLNGGTKLSRVGQPITIGFALCTGWNDCGAEGSDGK